VALKLLSTERSASARVQLFREALAIAKVNHPHVVAVHDVGASGDQVFIAMELVPGQSLRQWLSSQPRSFAEILSAFIQVGRGLSALHQAGLVHADVKPDNVMVGDDGRARVTDLGLSRSGQVLDVLSPRAGTQAYLSPEQWEGERPTAASDQYSFCVALCEALQGIRPRPGVAPALFSLRPRWLRAVLGRGLSRRPAERFSSIEHLVVALGRAGARSGFVRRALLVSGLILMAGASFGWSQWSRRAECAAEPLLAGIWDPRTRGQLDSALRSSPKPYAAAVAAEVARALDRFGENWGRRYRDACEARASSGISVRQLECLDERRGEVAALVTELSASPEAVVRAVSAVHALTPLTSCDRPRGLQSMTQTAARLVARSKALKDLGRYAEAPAPAKEAVEQLRSASTPGALSEALYTLGNAQLFAADYRAAEKTLREATLLADVGARDDIRVKSLSSLVHLLGVRDARYDEAEQIALAAWAVISRLEEDPSLQVDLLRAQGAMQYQRGRGAESKALLEKSLTLVERLEQPAGLKVAVAALSLGNAELGLGNDSAALALYRRALALDEALLGPDHPELARDLGNVALALITQGPVEESIALQRRALDILRAALGPTHPQYGVALCNLGSAHEAMEDPVSALAAFEEGLTLLRHSRGMEHPEIAVLLASIGTMERLLGRHTAAQEHLEESLRQQRKFLGVDHPDVGLNEVKLGGLLLEQGEISRGRALQREGLARVEAGHPQGHGDVAIALREIAAGLAANEAVPLLRRALALFELRNPIEAARTRLQLAKTLWALGTREEALSVARETQARCRAPCKLPGPIEDRLSAFLSQAQATDP
jgi:tetratricopeptide (TPR) repeat protein